MKTRSAPQSQQLVREQRRAYTNGRPSSSRIEEAPVCRGFFKARTFVLPAIILVLTGCFGNRIKPTEPPLVLKNWTSDEILDVISQRAGAIQQVKTLITVKIDGKRPPGFFIPVQSLQASLWTERPHQIRLQGFSPLGGTLFDLVSKDGRLQLSVPGRSKEVQKTLEEMLIRNKEKSSISSELLDALAGGGQPLLRPSESSAVEQNEREIILYQFLLDSTGKTRLLRKYWLEGDRLLTKQAVYFDPNGHPSVTVVYNDYQAIPSSEGSISSPEGARSSPGGARESSEEAIGSPEGEIVSPGGSIISPGGALNFWPREVTATLKGQGRLLITFREVKLNQPFQAGAFSFGALSR
jgi:hypothetical protein